MFKSKKKIKVAINGFGRIGRHVFKAGMKKRKILRSLLLTI